MSEGATRRWRRCSACKNDIALGAVHWVCSVSTCNRKRTGLVFCTVDCWEVHLPTERHREAWAVEAKAPKTSAPPEGVPKARSKGSGEATSKSTTAPAASEATSKSTTAPAASEATSKSTTAPAASEATSKSTTAPAASEGDILVVASKLKAYVKSASGFNTSDRVLPVLSNALRAICDEAIENARRAERQTVMDRDVPRPERTVGQAGRPALIRRRAAR